MSVSYILSRIKKLWNGIDIYIDSDFNWLKKMFIIIDFFASVLIYGAGVNDYFQYKFYKRRHLARKEFIVYKKRMKIVKTFNNESDRAIFDSKERFNQVFESFIGRDWLYVPESNFNSFEKFIKRVPIFIAKPTKGSHGKGVKIINTAEVQNKKSLFKNLLRDDAIIEELIIQHEELSKFNPTSVNSIRVVTLLCPDNKVRIMTANLRMGNGKKSADNFHHDGIAALLDIKTGTVISKGVDRNLKEYIYHPYTGKQIVGFKIPYWDAVVKTVSEAAKIVPTVGYIGWDVAIGKEGNIYIIEGNAAADPDISQIPDQIGKWPLYKKFVYEKMQQVKNKQK